jgi:hypothetical protein
MKTSVLAGGPDQIAPRRRAFGTGHPVFDGGGSAAATLELGAG